MPNPVVITEYNSDARSNTHKQTHEYILEVCPCPFCMYIALIKKPSPCLSLTHIWSKGDKVDLLDVIVGRERQSRS